MQRSRNRGLLLLLFRTQRFWLLSPQVNCDDRHGLLSDLVTALKSLPLVICTAAITTTKDGTVRDVFEIKPDDSSLSAEVRP